MQQYSICFDDDTIPAGAMRPARRVEILTVARELVTADELRNEDFSHPDRVKAFLRLGLAGSSTKSAGCSCSTAARA